MFRQKSLRIALAGGFLSLLALPAAAAELDVRVEGLAAAGDVHIYVFTSPEGFPKEENAAVHRSYPRPSGERNDLTVRVEVPDAAEFALVVFQDKDGDGRMNRLLGMIPQEPYGLSRNPEVFGKPKFPDAAIRPGNPPDRAPIVIRLRD